MCIPMYQEAIVLTTVLREQAEQDTHHRCGAVYTPVMDEHETKRTTSPQHWPHFALFLWSKSDSN